MDKELQELRKTWPGLYGNTDEVMTRQLQRYEKLIRMFHTHFGEDELHFFSTPGRTELGGNHTDHNHGRVLAASVDRDSIAVAAITEQPKVTMYSEGYEQPFEVSLERLTVIKEEAETTAALIRGIAARLQALGWKIGGLNLCLTSEVLPGSGLSSSAAIEVLIGTVFNALYNGQEIAPETIAKIGQFAENEYFGKPCGLMDQMACAIGGIIAIDFRDPQQPRVKRVDFDFTQQGYNLVVVNTGGHHADLTGAYAAIPREMKTVAANLDGKTCRDIDRQKLLDNLPALRKSAGDRAVLRALHYLAENERVLFQVKALEAGDFREFLRLVTASGNSSFKYLQNIYTTQDTRNQSLALALALTEAYLNEIEGGACRVHGGGFAGTILTFLPQNSIPEYIRRMETVFGKDCVLVLGVRPYGTLYLNGIKSY